MLPTGFRMGSTYAALLARACGNARRTLSAPISACSRGNVEDEWGQLVVHDRGVLGRFPGTTGVDVCHLRKVGIVTIVSGRACDMGDY